jgi:hypothetical protein
MMGMDQRKRKTSQGIRKAPPSYFAAMRGNRQILPVPTAIPIIESKRPHREVN